MSKTDKQISLIAVDAAVKPGAEGVAMRIPDAPVKLSAREREIWNHIANALYECKVARPVYGLSLAVIARTVIEWQDACVELARYCRAHGGSYIMETPNGYKQPHPLYYIARDKKKELAEWCDAMGLRFVPFERTMRERLAADSQRDLFDDPVKAYMETQPGAGDALQ